MEINGWSAYNTRPGEDSSHMQRRRPVPPGLRRLPAWLVASLLAELLLTLVGGCRPAAPAANTTSPSAAVLDFIQVGGVYGFVLHTHSLKAEVLEIRPDGWIRIKVIRGSGVLDLWRDDNPWLNMSQVVAVGPPE